MEKQQLLAARFASPDAAFAAIEDAKLDKAGFKAIPDQGEYLLIEREAPKAEAPKGAKGAKPARIGGRSKKDREAAKAAKAEGKPAEGKPGDMHYSLENLPSKEAIEAGLKGMAPQMRDHFKAALEGKLPDYDIFKLAKKEIGKDGKEKMESEETHRPFRSRRDELYAIRNKGRRDPEAGLKEALAWREGKGTRMTCSSTIPLGRFHQQLILALKAKIAGKRKEARAAAKAAPEAAAEAPPAA